MPSQMTPQKALEMAALATGLSTSRAAPPNVIVQHATSALRQLLNDGVPDTDPRCQALLQLINSARLVALPNSNDNAAARDLNDRAVHIDVSTATLTAFMGLEGTASLTGQAVALAKTDLLQRRHNNAPPPPVPAGPLKLRLLPKLAQAATDTIFKLVRTDDNLGLRAAHDATARAGNTPSRSRNRSNQRPSRRRRSSAVASVAAATSAVAGGPAAATALAASSAMPNGHPAPASSMGMPSANANLTPQPMPIVTPAGALPAAMQGNASFASVPLSQHAAAAYAAPGAAGPSGVMSGMQPMPAMPGVPPGAMGVATPQAMVHMQPNGEPVSGATLPPTQTATRFRPKPLPKEPRPKGTRSLVANQKGVMNDAIGTPDEIMEAFLQGPRMPAPQPGDPDIDSQTRIRAVLAERERNLVRLHRRRRAELAAMPLGMTEQTRRKAIIEAKQLSLLDLQRVVRHRVCAEMKKMHSLSVHEDGFVPSDNLSRLFRRRDPPIYSYMDGYPRITKYDGIPEMPPRHPETIAQDSLRMAKFDRSRMRIHARQRRAEFCSKLTKHISNFQNAAAEVKQARARLLKGFERHMVEKKRAEERRKKLEQIERLKLLRSNDEQAYLDLLKNTKNERLLQLVRQTDSYLMRIGAQVEREREGAEMESMVQPGPFSDELGGKSTKPGEVPIDEMRSRRDMYYTITHAVQEEVKQPSIMVHGTLKPYQLEGLKWMVSLYNNNLNGILADEMGLGKTIQTISLVTYLVEVKKNPGPFMIIVPLSTLGNWVRELDLWAPSLTTVVYRGDKNTRRNITRTQLQAGTFNVLLTTYEFTVKDQTVLSPIGWKYIIIDEGHRMKNANCKLAMTLGVKYKSRNRLLLTGTPLQNNLTELWALLNFLLPTIFSSADTFETWFKQPFESTTLGDTAELEEEETLLVINRLHQVLRPFLLRRLKTDVLGQLPEKVEHVIRCDMSAWQRALYRQVEKRINVATGANNGSSRSFNNLLMQCKKVCNHPYLFYDFESIEHLPPDFLIRASGKLFLLQHMLPKLKLHGHRTLIFSQMTAAMDYLEVFLAHIGIKYMRLDGNTRADDRQELLNKFNADDSDIFCFLLSTRAGGLGLNLQTADTVIIFDSDWNPMMDLQAQDRAHRIGQTRAVRVYRLISSGTVEVKILEQANKKLQVDAQVIQAGQFNNKSTESDRHAMLKNLLRQKQDEDKLGDVPTMEELNRLIARTDEEIEEYAKYDEEAAANGTTKPLFQDEKDLPEWVLKPEAEEKSAGQKEMEMLESHGRGRRQRKTMHEMDKLTDAEWLKVMEGDMTVEEAIEKRRRRQEARKSKGEGGEGDENETNGEDDDGDQATPNADGNEEDGDEDSDFCASDADGSSKRRKSSSKKSKRAKKERKAEGSNANNAKNARQENGVSTGERIKKVKLKVGGMSSKDEGNEASDSKEIAKTPVRRKRQREGADEEVLANGVARTSEDEDGEDVSVSSGKRRKKGSESCAGVTLKIVIPNGKMGKGGSSSSKSKSRVVQTKLSMEGDGGEARRKRKGRGEEREAKRVKREMLVEGELSMQRRKRKRAGADAAESGAEAEGEADGEADGGPNGVRGSKRARGAASARADGDSADGEPGDEGATGSSGGAVMLKLRVRRGRVDSA